MLVKEREKQANGRTDKRMDQHILINFNWPRLTVIDHDWSVLTVSDVTDKKTSYTSTLWLIKKKKKEKKRVGGSSMVAVLMLVARAWHYGVTGHAGTRETGLEVELGRKVGHSKGHESWQEMKENKRYANIHRKTDL